MVRPPGAVSPIAVSSAEGWPAASTTTAALTAASVASAVYRSHEHREYLRQQLLRQLVDGYHVHAGIGQCGYQRSHADAAEADDRYRLPGLRLADIEYRAAPGEHRATQQRGDRRRDIMVHRYDAGPVDDGMRRETRHAQVVVEPFAVRLSLSRHRATSRHCSLRCLADTGSAHRSRMPRSAPQRGKKVITTR